jgi:HPt (histidine-containing phosphotransfer) domain-containing protein
VIRARGGSLATVPIIAFTANAFAEDVQACRNAGMNEFVVKPTRKKMLIATMARALASAPSPPGEVCMAPPIAPCEPKAFAGGHMVSSGDETNSDPLMDHTVFDTLVAEIGEEFAGQMLGVFLEETVTRLQLLNTLSCPNDRVQIEREAHSLKSAAGTFGFKRLSRWARTVEIEAPHMSDAEFRRVLRQIGCAFEMARALLPAGT